MGGLTSRPKVPSVQTTQIVSQPVTAPVAATTEADAEPEADLEQQASELRSESLLSRGRSRFGTVRTSFRGLLDNADAQSLESMGEQDLKKMMRNPKYWKEKDPAFVKKVTEGFKEIYS